MTTNLFRRKKNLAIKILLAPKSLATKFWHIATKLFLTKSVYSTTKIHYTATWSSLIPSIATKEYSLQNVVLVTNIFVAKAHYGNEIIFVTKTTFCDHNVLSQKEIWNITFFILKIFVNDFPPKYKIFTNENLISSLNGHF